MKTNTYSLLTLSLKAGPQITKNFTCSFLRGIIPSGNNGVVLVLESGDSPLPKDCEWYVIQVSTNRGTLPPGCVIVGSPVQVGGRWYVVASTCFS